MQTNTTSNWKRISADEAAHMLEETRNTGELAVFDSRDMASYEESHVRGADHLSEYSFGEIIRALPKSTPVMIYCYHGNASQIYAQMFTDFRYREVYSVDGGYEALAEAYHLHAKH